MNVSVEAREVVVVVAIVSVAPDPGCDFLFCESLPEAFLVLVEAAMDGDIKDGGGHGDRGPLWAGTLYVRVCDVEE